MLQQLLTLDMVELPLLTGDMLSAVVRRKKSYCWVVLTVGGGGSLRPYRPLGLMV